MTETMTRRRFGYLTAGIAAFYPFNGHLESSGSKTECIKAIRALVFDAFVIFNPANVLAGLKVAFPTRGSALFSEWRAREFEYSWLRALSGKYVDFWQVTEDTLFWSTNKLGLTLLQDQTPAFNGTLSSNEHVA